MARVLSPREAREGLEPATAKDGGERWRCWKWAPRRGECESKNSGDVVAMLRPVAPRRCALAAASGAAARAAEMMSKKKRRDALAHFIRSRSPRLTPSFGSAEVLTISSSRLNRIRSKVRSGVPLQEPPRDMSATPARVAIASRSVIAPRASRPPHRPASHARVRRARPVVPVVVPRAGLEDTSDASSSVRSPAEEGKPTVTGPFPVDLSTLTADERAWLDARDELRVLVLGKTGVGKSSLVNAIANANSAIGRLDVGTTQVQRVENSIEHDDESHDVCLFDTPGFFDVEGRTPAGVLRELGGKVDDYHAIVYAHVATDRRLRLEDEQSVSFIVRALGARCVSRVVVALTFANEIAGDDGTADEVLATRGAQASGLFADAAARVEGASVEGASSVEGAVWVPCGSANDDGRHRGWEGDLWRAVIRRAKAAADANAAGSPPAPFDESYDCTAAELEIDWDGLAASGISLQGAPPKRPPPPLELVRAYVSLALGEYVSNDGRKERSAFAVKQRGMPSGFAATVVLEVYGPLDPERRGNGATTNAIYMLMPGTAADTVMKVRMGSVEDDELPSPAALRRGGAEVTVGGLSVNGSGPVTLRLDRNDGSFVGGTTRVSAGGIVEIDPETGDAVVMARKTPDTKEERG